jgi:hypothetical protein
MVWSAVQSSRAVICCSHPVQSSVHPLSISSHPTTARHHMKSSPLHVSRPDRRALTVTAQQYHRIFSVSMSRQRMYVPATLHSTAPFHITLHFCNHSTPFHSISPPHSCHHSIPPLTPEFISPRPRLDDRPASLAPPSPPAFCRRRRMVRYRVR